MIKPFQIIWELIEFLLQALFVYILAIIVIVGLITYTIITLDKERQQLIIEKPKYIYSKEHIEKTINVRNNSFLHLIHNFSLIKFLLSL